MYDSNSGSPRTPITTKPPSFAPEGYHVARCVALVEIGTIWVVRHHQHQVRLTFEFPEILRAYDTMSPELLSPKQLSKNFASKLYNNSHLKKFLIQWVGEGAIEGKENFDPFIIVGEPALVQIKHQINQNSGKWWEDIADIKKLQVTAPPQVSPSTVLTYNAWDGDVFRNLPDYVREMMMGSHEYKQKFSNR